MKAREWIEFHRGSAREAKGAAFEVFGPWQRTNTADSDPRGARGEHTRDGWRLHWHGRKWPSFYTVTVPTFADLLRVVRLGPDEAARRMDAAHKAASKALGVRAVTGATWCV